MFKGLHGYFWGLSNRAKGAGLGVGFVGQAS